MATLINVGCGSLAHPAWHNFDVAPQLPHVRAVDVRLGLPVADGSADAVYSSHVLEHLTEAEAASFLSELWRVLAPGGVIRVVVPDLEAICRIYLEQLEALRSGVQVSDFPYRFALLELFDQVVRDRSGGELLSVYRNAQGVDADYVLQRHGAEAAPHIGQSALARAVQANSALSIPANLTARLAKLRMRALLLCRRVLGGDAAEQRMRIGAFRQSGEVHRAMYDSYRLAALLLQQGFVDPRSVGASESSIEDFATYELDQVAGKIRKPDSLFFEALKPL